MSERTPHFNHDLNLGHEAAQTKLEQFANNPWLDELAGLYGVPELPEDTSERIATLKQIAANHWDFRKGAERQVVDWNSALINEKGSVQKDIVFSAAERFGMLASSKPENRHPNYLVVLGGANKAPLDRLRYALESVDDYDLLVYMGSSRTVSDKERIAAKDYAPNAQTEFDLGSSAIETYLDGRLVSQDRERRDNDIWAWREYQFEWNGATKTAIALNSPKELHVRNEGKRRATSLDNYEFFAGRADLAHNPDASVVAVTTGLYVPSQQLRAVKALTLPYGTSIEVIGHSAEYSGANRTASQLLQETKAAVDAAARLDVALQS